MPKVYAYVTGERVTAESAEHGDAAERGWVDPTFSMREFFDNRNDARPVMDEWMPHDNLPDVLRPAEPLEEIVADALARYLGAWEDNGDGTFYGVDATEDYSTGDTLTYAVHFTLKDGSTERPWHPSELGDDWERVS